MDEQEVPVDLTTDMLGELFHISLVLRRLDGVVLVVEPVVVKIGLDAFSQILLERSILIKVGKESEELTELLRFFVVSRDLLEVHEDLDKLTHDVGEAGDTDEQNKGRDNSLRF